MIRTAPAQLQIAMASLIHAIHHKKLTKIASAEPAYECYKMFCDRASQRPLPARAFSELVNELDMHSLVRSRVTSKGRYGRSREILFDLTEDILNRI